MKGTSVFTPEEAILIKSTLDACREAGRYAQKDLRTSLRKQYKFYISDFDRSLSGFTSTDFDHHVSIGSIKIVEDPHVSLLAEFKNFDYKSDQAKIKFEELTFRVENHTFINEEHKYLHFILLTKLKKHIPEIIMN